MKGFSLDNDGDVIIENKDIKMVSDIELLRQKVKSILSTCKNEWFLNIDEGINFNNLLGKKKSDDIIRNEILEGLKQVDSTFILESFSCSVNDRHLIIKFSARTSSDIVITEEAIY